MGNLLDEIRILIRSFSIISADHSLGALWTGMTMRRHQIQFYRGPTRWLTGPKAAKALAFAAALPFHIVRRWRDLILGKKPENRRD